MSHISIEENIGKTPDQKILSEQHAAALHRRHVSGAWIRALASIGIYATMLLGWISGTFSTPSFQGMTIIAIMLVAINPPSVWILGRIRNRRLYELVSISINIFETTCFTGLVYFAGGVAAGHILLVFAGMIAYLGVAAPRRITITVAVVAILEYNAMILLEHFGFLEHQSIKGEYRFELLDIQTIGVTTTGLLAVVAYASVVTGAAIKKNRNNLRRRNLELDQINSISQLANRTLDLSTLLDSVCRELTHLLPLKYVAIGLIDQIKEQLEVVAFYSPQESIQSHHGFILPFEGFSATREVISSRRPLILKDAHSNPQTKQLHEHFQELGIKSIMIVPLFSRSQPIGSIAMPANDPDHSFSETDVNLIQTIAGQVSAAITNAQLYARTESALDIAERDLEIGRQIQSGFLPANLPLLKDWELSSTFLPARQVAGDFYDAFPIGDEGKFMFLVGDVCDKGVGAALFMVVFRSLIRSFSLARSPGADLNKYIHSIVNTVNTYICDTHDRENMFATLFIGLVDPSTERLHFINAGHDVPYIVDQQGNLRQRLQPTGPALGLMSDAEFAVENLTFAEGDMLLAYTDGVIDSRDPAGLSYNESRLLAGLHQPFSSALSLVTHIELSIKEHIQQTDQFDDIAIICVRHNVKNTASRHEITSTSKLENLSVLRRFIDKAAIELMLPESVSFSFKLSLDEIFTNISTHGYGEEGAGPIQLSFSREKNKINLVIEDEGIAFDSSETPEVDVTEDLDQRSVGGLGLFLVEEMMDQVLYSRTNEGVNRTTLIKNYEEGV